MQDAYVFKKVCIFGCCIFFFSGNLSKIIINSSGFLFYFNLNRDSNTVLEIRAKMFYLKHSGRNSLRICCMQDTSAVGVQRWRENHTLGGWMIRTGAMKGC